MNSFALFTTLIISSASASFLDAKSSLIDSRDYTTDDIGILASSFNGSFRLKTIDKKIPVIVRLYEETKEATLYLANSLTSYFLVGNNYSVFSYEYDIRVLKTGTSIEYNEISREFNSDFLFESIENNTISPQNSGDNKKECKLIENEQQLNAHVADYFPGGTLKYTSLLSSVTAYSQRELSCYERDGYISEANCSTTAAFNVLSYLRDSKHYSQFLKLPGIDRKMRYNPKVFEYDAYSYFKSLPDHYVFYDDEDKECRVWQDLYVELRNEARKINFKYMASGEGLWAAHASRIMETVCSKYEIEGFDGIEHTDYNAYVGSQEFKDSFYKFKPTIMSTDGCCYGSHSFEVIGYKMYSREVKQLFWTKTEWSTILVVKDGWSKNTHYFDITHYKRDDGGFGMMTYFKWKE